MRLDWHQERISPSAETKCSAPCDVGEATSVGCAVGAEGALYGLRDLLKIGHATAISA